MVSLFSLFSTIFVFTTMVRPSGCEGTKYWKWLPCTILASLVHMRVRNEYIAKWCLVKTDNCRYISHDQFAGAVYPPFCSGSSYAMTTKAARDILKATPNFPIIHVRSCWRVMKILRIASFFHKCVALMTISLNNLLWNIFEFSSFSAEPCSFS